MWIFQKSKLYCFCICINLHFFLFFFLFFFQLIIHLILHDSFSYQDFSIWSLANPFVPESFLICNNSFSSFDVLCNRDIWSEVFCSTVEAFKCTFDLYSAVILDVKWLPCQHRECFHIVLMHALCIFFQSEDDLDSTWFNHKSILKILDNLVFYWNGRFTDTLSSALTFFIKIQLLGI